MPITVSLPAGSATPAMTLELSKGGLSAWLNAPLTTGDKADLERVGGGRVSAMVRRKLGQVCGFEFLEISVEKREKVCTL
jgi:hypothetical protein